MRARTRKQINFQILIFRIRALYQATNLTKSYVHAQYYVKIVTECIHALNLAKIMTLNFLYMCTIIIAYR